MRAEQYKLFQFLKIVILTFVFLTVIVSQGNAQDTLQGKKFTDYNFSRFTHETGLFFVQPVKWKGADWIRFGAIAILTVSIIQVDNDVRKLALDNPKYVNTVPMEIGNQWGGFFLVPISAVALLTHGTLSDNNTTKKLGFEIAQAALYSETISFISKGCIGRSRPFTNRGFNDYKPFTFFDSPQNSFPAGHVDAAFALSTVLAKNTDSGWLKVASYIPAGLTVVSRIYQDEHWASDVFLGGAIGYFVGNWVVNLHEQKESTIELTSVFPLQIKIALN
ncbi:MAG: phosphatase PAP2 family protein [Bacteroidetes bacterium]|nr:phosphatase PAP2 family protein [Bacteroidota bacterium]